MKISTKMLLVVFLTPVLLFSCSVMAAAEMLLGVSAETGTLNFSADYVSLTDVSGSPNGVILTGDLNLLLLHINAEYGTAEIGSDAFSTAVVKAGWEIGPGLLKAKLYGGYRVYTFKNDLVDTFGGVVGSLGVESKLGKFTIYGETELPLLIQYTNGAKEDKNASLSYLKLGASYAPLPMIDVFANYRTMTATSNWVDISATGFMIGAKFSL